MDTYETFEALHKPQLETSGVPQQFWKTLHEKLLNQTFDAGEKFSIFLVDYGEDEPGEEDPRFRVFISSVDGVSPSDPEQIYLIDHAWTYPAREAKKYLQQVPGLLARMVKLMGCCEDLPASEQIDQVCRLMWKYNQPYSVANGANAEDRLPIWYIMDEFGSAIQHSDDPSFRVVPFIHVPEQVTYSILFPVRDTAHNEEVTRNFIEKSVPFDDETKRALLVPWFPSSFTDISFEQEEPGKEYFLAGRREESLPDIQNLECSPKRNCDVLKVYAEYKYIHEYLNHPNFCMVDNENEADILWLLNHFKQFKSLSVESPQKFINQFPFEHVIVVKDLLCIVSRRKMCKGVSTYDEDTLETYPPWLPTTFNLETELPKFLSYYQQREEKALDNHWICKPWNLARGLDIHITGNLNYILRLPFSGPKIAQKYVSDPVLFERPDIGGKVKFDVRFVILLKSVEPLRAYAYRNFFLRFANKPFDLNDFDDYEKHFTVMNYSEEAPLCKMLHTDFILEFGKQYPNQTWSGVEKDIFGMLREVVDCATQREPPCGIAHSPQSRALYAVDLMLEWQTMPDGMKKVQPKLLEINWMPDCERACKYYPDFYNDIFSLLFLDIENDSVFATL